MKRIRFLVVSICLILMLTACGKSAKKRTIKDITPTGITAVTPTSGEVSMTPTPSLTPTPTPSPTPKVPEEAYRQANKENLYCMDITKHLENGYNYYDGEVRDGYVLLQLFKEGTEDWNRRFCVFPVLNPAALVIGEIEGSMDEYPRCMLANDGNVLAIYEETHRVIWNPQLGADAKSWNYEAGSFAGCSDDGFVWFTENGGLLKGYSFIENRQVAYCYKNAGNNLFFCNFCGQQGDKIYFSTQIPSSRLYVIDRTGDSVERVSFIIPDASYVNNAAYFTSQENIMISDFVDTERLFLLPKNGSMQNILSYSEKYLTTFCMDFGTDGDYSTEQYILMYDLKNGGIAGRIASEEFKPAFDDIQPMGVTEEGYLILQAWNAEKGTRELYLYDASKGTTEPGDSIRVYRRGEKYPTAYSFAKSLEERYPSVRILYDEVGLDMFSNSFRLVAKNNEEKICDALIRLEQCLSIYPEGMIEELSGLEKEGLFIYLCDDFIRTSPLTISNPVACTDRSRNYLELCIGLKWINDLEATLSHEMMHLFEYRIGEYGLEHGLHPIQYWKQVLNSPECPLIDSYVDDNGNNISDYTGTAVRDPRNAWFIDAYAKSSFDEDLARVLEYMTKEGFAHYFSGPHLQAKGKFLCAIIREVFPSVHASETLMPWERIFGKVSFDEYYELLK